MKEWFRAAAIRAIKTMAQTAIATIGAAAVIEDVNWLVVLSASVLAGVLSLLTSIAGLPEVNKVNDDEFNPDVLQIKVGDGSDMEEFFGGGTDGEDI